MNKGVVTGLIIAGAVVGAGFGVTSFEHIGTGRVGVVYSPNGGVQNETLSQGIHFISPLDRVKEFTIGNEQLILSKDSREGSEEDDSFPVTTKDNATIKVSFQASYRFDPEKVVDTYKKFKGMDGEDIVNERVRTVLKSRISEVTSKYTLMEIYSGNRGAVNKDITEYLDKELKEDYGIEVIDASIIDVHPDKELTSAIKKRMTAMQKAEQAKAEQEAAKVEAETKLIKAKNKAEVEIAEANGKAEANRALSQSLTPQLIQMKEAEARYKHGWVEVQGADTVVTR